MAVMIRRRFTLLSTVWHAVQLTLILCAAFCSFRNADAVTFTVQGPGANSNDFRITTFASGLDVPLGIPLLFGVSLF